jgi:hypothetical protein
VEANDPPYFASPEVKQEAEFAALPADEQKRRTELRRQRQEWLANQKGAERRRLADAEKCLDVVARQAWACGLQQIPATVIDKGVLRRVPYQSFRAGDYEVNIYGDPASPAGLEVGIYASLLRSQPAKGQCVEFMAALLNDPADRAMLKSLKMSRDLNERTGLTFEVTPETAEDAYGGWWVSVYDPAALDQSRASPKELSEITVPKQAPEPDAGGVGPSWSPRQQALARPGGKSVYVPSYVRKDGTYVRTHTRAAPGSGGGRHR